MMFSPTELNLSPNQERYFFAEKFTANSYALPVSLVLTGAVDIAGLKEVLLAVISKHDVFNLKLVKQKDGTVIQQVSQQPVLNFDYRALADGSDKAIKQSISDYFFKKQDIVGGALFKSQLLEIAANKFIFTFSLHHIVCDGISIEIIKDELSRAWNNLEDYKQQAPSSFLSCLQDHHLAEPAPEADATFWQHYLAGAQDTHIPSDFEVAAHTHKTISATLPQELIRQLESYALRHGVSKFNVLYAVYNLMIAKYSGSLDICTTFQSSGRRGLNNADKVIGLFSNALVLRAQISGQQAVSAFCRNLRQDVTRCLQHERQPYHLVIKNSGVHPKFGFNWYPSPLPMLLDGLDVAPYGTPQWESDFTLNLHCTDLGDTVSLDMHYDAGAFSESRMQVFLEHFAGGLRQIFSDAEAKIADIALHSQLDKALPDPGAALQGTKGDRLIFDQFMAVAEKAPEKIAINYGSKTWTYAEVEEISGTIATALISSGSPKRVAIYSDRNPALVMSMLGVLRAGAAFAVLDNSYPPHRLAEYGEIIRPDALIVCTTDQALPVELEQAAPVPRLWLPHDISSKNSPQSSVQSAAGAVRASADDTAYFLFTSGTTGKPKCVASTHSPLVHFIDWQRATFSITGQDKVTFLSGLGHDPALRDIFTTLSCGASLQIPDQDFIYNPAFFYQWMLATRPTVAHVTPPLSKLICGAFPKNKPLHTLRYFFTGGDSLKNEHVDNLRRVFPETQVVNFYGASETPQAMSYFVVPANAPQSKIPIGFGIADAQILVMSTEGKRAGIGEIGQIAIRTPYLSQGYIGNDVASGSNKAISEINGITAYNTGDYGYYRSDGAVVFIGRMDDQVKIRGFRIELNDISAGLSSLAGVKEALCTVMNSANDDKKIVAYLVKEAESGIETADVAARLAALLPAYMMPNFFVWLDKIPLLPNGKTDRNALPQPTLDDLATSARQYEPPANAQEENIVKEFESILGISPIGINDSFTSLGGDSLSYVQVSLFFESLIGHVPANWNALSIKELADIGHRKSWVYHVSSSIVIRAISIVLVVLGHFWVTGGLKGATEALLLISGYTFADFQLKAIAHRNTVRPVLVSVLNIAVPTILYTLLLSAQQREFKTPILLLYSNFIDPEMAGGIGYWFVQILLQIYLIAALILSVHKVRKFAIEKPYPFGVIFLLISAALAYGVPYLWDTDHLYNRVPHMKIWLFALGWCLFHSKTLREKFIILVLAAVLPPLIFHSHAVHPLILSFSVLLLYMPAVAIITPLHKVIYALAGASLFIYLTHFQFRQVFHKLVSGLDSPPLDVLVGLLGGIFAWYCWNALSSLFKRSISKLKAA